MNIATQIYKKQNYGGLSYNGVRQKGSADSSRNVFFFLIL